jgi:hypothetical protein
MQDKYIYRFFKSTWGIYIELSAEAVPLSGYKSTHGLIEITPAIWLDTYIVAPHRSESEEQFYLVKGVQLIVERFEEKLRELTVIAVSQATYPLTDFQPEGLACAIIGWASERFSFTAPHVPIEFDRAANRYVFHFDQLSG